MKSENEGVLVFQDRKQVYYNPRLLEMSGYSAEDYEKQSFMSLIHPDDVEVVVKNIEDLVEDKNFKEKLEFRFINKARERKWGFAKFSR
jgi:PAS domain S-box-containing protein